MSALKLFLIKQSRFNITDFTLSNWAKLISIGNHWEKIKAGEEMPDSKLPLGSEWEEILPTLDIWISASKSEIHYISHLLPVLKWDGGLIGVRFRLEPDDIEKLYKEYLSAFTASSDTLKLANKQNSAADAAAQKYSLKLWPSDLQDFLSHRGRLGSFFKVKSYLLDYTKINPPVEGKAFAQPLPAGSEALEANPLKGLIQIDLIDAQRGFSDLGDPGTGDSGDDSHEGGGSRKLSEQLKRYYSKHLDPSELPDPADIDALEGIHLAQKQFDSKLEVGFEKAFDELRGMGYPGLTDPKLRIVTKVEPLEGMSHSSSVQYDVLSPDDGAVTITAKLPEQSSGLGYQNLISIIFRLISFRDNWMLEGKAQKKRDAEGGDTKIHPPLHLVLVEEPEAHLHAQVQQVFIRKAYNVLRNHDQIKKNPHFKTQLVVSTHSSHVVYEADFAALRYFRRIPPLRKAETPSSVVANLSGLFGDADKTQRFRMRYLRTTHCDLFFADAVIIVEGAAERMLLPHFIRENFSDPIHGLYHRYLSILEVGGSFAHCLRPLIDALALPTLLITDLDTGLKDATSKRYKSEQPALGEGMVTMNSTLRDWHPKQPELDKLAALSANDKVLKIDDYGSLRVAFQMPVAVRLDSNEGTIPHNVIPYTFEDCLALENLETFKNLGGLGMIARFSEAIHNSKTVPELATNLYKALDGSKKGRFALDLLFEVPPNQLVVPGYIAEGLEWLQKELQEKDEKILVAPISIKETKEAVMPGDDEISSPMGLLIEQEIDSSKETV